MSKNSNMNACLSFRGPSIEDQNAFIEAMKASQNLHHPWVQAPVTSEEFEKYLARYQQPNQESYLIFEGGQIVGVFNLNEIVRGVFQSAYLAFYAVAGFAGKGYMSAGLRLILEHAFTVLKLHRLEANIQPGNMNSINLVKANGFEREGYSPRYLYIDSEWRDHERWAITYETWLTYFA